MFLRQSASTTGNKIILILFTMPLFVTRVTRKELRAELQCGTRALPPHNTSRMTRAGSAGGPRGRASFRPPAWKCRYRPEIGPHRGGKLLQQNGSKACSKRKTRTMADTREERDVNAISPERKTPWDNWDGVREQRNALSLPGVHAVGPYQRGASSGTRRHKDRSRLCRSQPGLQINERRKARKQPLSGRRNVQRHWGANLSVLTVIPTRADGRLTFK